MYTHKTKWLHTIIVVVAMYPAHACTADSSSPSSRFAEIQKTIDANCGECYGASKEQFIPAVKALEGLIAAGFDDPAAKKLLAKSYRTWAFVYSKDGSAESAEMLQKARAVYSELVKQTPEDASVWTAYSQILDDPKDAMVQLRRAESLSPNDAFVQFSLGMLYAHGLNNPAEGVLHLQRALELEDGYSKFLYGEQLARVFELMGSGIKANKVRAEMKAFEQELESKHRAREAKSPPNP